MGWHECYLRTFALFVADALPPHGAVCNADNDCVIIGRVVALASDGRRVDGRAGGRGELLLCEREQRRAALRRHRYHTTVERPPKFFLRAHLLVPVPAPTCLRLKV